MIDFCSMELEYSPVTARIAHETQKKRDASLAERKCLGCERPLGKNEGVRRGLCSACYQAALRAIKEKKTTAANLMREGRMLPRSKGGRPTQNPFTIEMSRM